MGKVPFTPRLPALWAISVLDERESAAWSVPSMVVQQNISLAWKILTQIVEDWKSAAQDFQLRLEEEVSDPVLLEFDVIQNAQPRFIQCLFSYITFFFALESGYSLIYSQLNKLNKELKLNLPHDKFVERSEFVRKLWRIRNFSIAHWGATEKKEQLDLIAGRYWDWYCSEKNNEILDIEQMGFGIMKASRLDINSKTAKSSADRKIESIPKTHQQCSKYLSKLDTTCVAYLASIKSKLPLVIDGRRYRNPEEWKIGRPWTWD